MESEKTIYIKIAADLADLDLDMHPDSKGCMNPDGTLFN